MSFELRMAYLALPDLEKRDWIVRKMNDAQKLVVGRQREN